MVRKAKKYSNPKVKRGVVDTARSDDTSLPAQNRYDITMALSNETSSSESSEEGSSIFEGEEHSVISSSESEDVSSSESGSSDESDNDRYSSGRSRKGINQAGSNDDEKSVGMMTFESYPVIGGLLDNYCSWMDRQTACFGFMSNETKEVSLLRESKMKTIPTMTKVTKMEKSLSSRLSTEEKRSQRLERKGLVSSQPLLMEEILETSPAAKNPYSLDGLAPPSASQSGSHLQSIADADSDYSGGKMQSSSRGASARMSEVPSIGSSVGSMTVSTLHQQKPSLKYPPIARKKLAQQSSADGGGSGDMRDLFAFPPTEDEDESVHGEGSCNEIGEEMSFRTREATSQYSAVEEIVHIFPDPSSKFANDKSGPEEAANTNASVDVPCSGSSGEYKSLLLDEPIEKNPGSTNIEEDADNHTPIIAHDNEEDEEATARVAGMESTPAIQSLNIAAQDETSEHDVVSVPAPSLMEASSVDEYFEDDANEAEEVAGVDAEMEADDQEDDVLANDDALHYELSLPNKISPSRGKDPSVAGSVVTVPSNSSSEQSFVLSPRHVQREPEIDITAVHLEAEQRDDMSPNNNNRTYSNDKVDTEVEEERRFFNHREQMDPQPAERNGAMEPEAAPSAMPWRGDGDGVSGVVDPGHEELPLEPSPRSTEILSKKQPMPLEPSLRTNQVIRSPLSADEPVPSPRSRRSLRSPLSADEPVASPKSRRTIRSPLSADEPIISPQSRQSLRSPPSSGEPNVSPKSRRSLRSPPSADEPVASPRMTNSYRDSRSENMSAKEPPTNSFNGNNIQMGDNHYQPIVSPKNVEHLQPFDSLPEDDVASEGTTSTNPVEAAISEVERMHKAPAAQSLSILLSEYKKSVALEVPEAREPPSSEVVDGISVRSPHSHVSEASVRTSHSVKSTHLRTSAEASDAILHPAEPKSPTEKVLPADPSLTSDIARIAVGDDEWSAFQEPQVFELLELNKNDSWSLDADDDAGSTRSGSIRSRHSIDPEARVLPCPYVADDNASPRIQSQPTVSTPRKPPGTAFSPSRIPTYTSTAVDDSPRETTPNHSRRRTFWAEPEQNLPPTMMAPSPRNEEPQDAHNSSQGRRENRRSTEGRSYHSSSIRNTGVINAINDDDSSFVMVKFKAKSKKSMKNKSAADRMMPNVNSRRDADTSPPKPVAKPAGSSSHNSHQSYSQHIVQEAAPVQQQQQQKRMRELPKSSPRRLAHAVTMEDKQRAVKDTREPQPSTPVSQLPSPRVPPSSVRDAIQQASSRRVAVDTQNKIPLEQEESRTTPHNHAAAGELSSSRSRRRAANLTVQTGFEPSTRTPINSSTHNRGMDSERGVPSPSPRHSTRNRTGDADVENMKSPKTRPRKHTSRTPRQRDSQESMDAGLGVSSGNGSGSSSDNNDNAGHVKAARKTPRTPKSTRSSKIPTPMATTSSSAKAPTLNRLRSLEDVQLMMKSMKPPSTPRDRLRLKDEDNNISSNKVIEVHQVEPDRPEQISNNSSSRRRRHRPSPEEASSAIPKEQPSGVIPNPPVMVDTRDEGRDVDPRSSLLASPREDRDEQSTRSRRQKKKSSKNSSSNSSSKNRDPIDSTTKELKRLERKLEKQLRQVKRVELIRQYEQKQQEQEAQQEEEEVWDDATSTNKELRQIEKHLEKKLKRDDEKRATRLKRLRQKPSTPRAGTPDLESPRVVSTPRAKERVDLFDKAKQAKVQRAHNRGYNSSGSSTNSNDLGGPQHPEYIHS